MMIKNRIIILFFTVLLISSCVTPKRVNYLQDIGSAAPDTAQYNMPDYKLQVGDQLYIQVSSLDKETSTLFSPQQNTVTTGQELYYYTIYPDGNIKFPFAGMIYLKGTTTREAKDIMREKLQSIAPGCDVSVQLANSYFTVVGTAGNGRYPVPKEKMNVYQALAISGDLQSFSDRAKVHVMRPTGDSTQVKTFDVRSKHIIGSENYYIRPNDVIYVQSFKGQFFRWDSFGAILTTVTSTFSLGYLLYGLIAK